MKLVFITPVKLLKVSEIIFSKKKPQVINICFSTSFDATGMLLDQVEREAKFTYYGVCITVFQIVHPIILLQISLSPIWRLGSC